MSTEEEFRSAVQSLHYFQRGNRDCFFSMLYMLIFKADQNDLMKIAAGFPAHVAAFIKWQKAGNYGEDLFKEWLNGEV